MTDSAPHAQWWVRQAGRRSGPFALDRLRVMASRGALTRFHQLSSDGERWVPAGAVVPEVEHARGGPAQRSSPQMQFDDSDLLPSVPTSAFELPSGSPMQPAPPEPPEWPEPSLRRAPSATVRAALWVAVVCGGLALCAPTDRTPAGDLQWWARQSAMNVAVHAMAAAVIGTWWITAALSPSSVLGSALAAASALLAVAVALPLYEWAPWTIPAGAAMAASAVLIAHLEPRPAHTRPMATAALVLAVGLAAGAAVLALRAPFAGVWAVLGCGLVGVGAFGLRSGAPAPRVFALLVAAMAACSASQFAAAIVGLLGSNPMHGAAASVAALLSLSLAVLAWVGTRQALSAVPSTAHDAPNAPNA